MFLNNNRITKDHRPNPRLFIRFIHTLSTTCGFGATMLNRFLQTSALAPEMKTARKLRAVFLFLGTPKAITLFFSSCTGESR